jgi:hypothetical protein
MFKFSVKIAWQTPQLIPVVSARSWIVRRRFSWLSSQIFSTFTVVLLEPGCPEHSSSSTDTPPALKRECHSKTAVQLKECFPKASRSISRVLVANLPSFKEKLDVDKLLNFAIHRRQNETRSQKALM